MAQDVKSYASRARRPVDRQHTSVRRLDTPRHDVVTRPRSIMSRASHSSGPREHLLTHGPKLGFDRPTFDRVVRMVKTRSAINSILAITQHALKAYMQARPKYFNSLKATPGGRMIDLEALRQAISDFRQFMALIDLVFVYKQFKSHRMTGGSRSDYKNLIGLVRIGGIAVYTLFEGLEWLASKGIYKTSHDPEKQVRRNRYMLQASSWGYMVAIVATFVEHLTSATSRGFLRTIPRHMRTKTHHGRAYREKRADIIRSLLGGLFWAPVCYDLGVPSQPLKRLNPIFTILAHATNVQGCWAGSHASKIKGPGKAGTLEVVPVDTPAPPPSRRRR